MYQGTLDPVSNRADWFLDLELIDDSTGLALNDLSDIAFNLQVRAAPPQGVYSNGRQNYPNDYYGFCGQTVLTAVTGDSHTSVDGTTVTFHFLSTEMSRLVQGSYEVGLTVTRDSIVEQELIANFSVVDGIVRP